MKKTSKPNVNFLSSAATDGGRSCESKRTRVQSKKRERKRKKKEIRKERKKGKKEKKNPSGKIVLFVFCSFVRRF